MLPVPEVLRPDALVGAGEEVVQMKLHLGQGPAREHHSVRACWWQFNEQNEFLNCVDILRLIYF